ncbi:MULTISPECIES: P-II family nitrogen regulator [Novosphingobium]|uniref:Nitrogen regulatory protein P-II n=1 Tax=Novosphingobium pentaromativorans TaxID=205844 RepID=A0A2W5QDL3_9SPHN|nr:MULTISPECIES: P-II family nitrogen regulator [Novosphingobium]PZQ52823.1 MAG: P-II family nitrogen regulator [Novosphingobium pentaromativorans]GFE73168.1 nitrogen regulatory protein P-II 1 [Novosphingobium sp. TCA1]
MKYIIAIIKPFRFAEVKDALSAAGVSGLTVSEVSGFGRQKGQTEIYRGAEYASSMVPKLKLEIAVSDAFAGTVIEIIRTTASTEEIGDGKIFVLDLADVLRVRTGEQGDIAL